MTLTLENLKNKEEWQQKSIKLPLYDIQEMRRETMENPIWLHFGAGNIFRMFIAKIAQDLLDKGLTKSGIICAETFGFDIVDAVYKAYDNLCLKVTLNTNGTKETEVVASIANALKCSKDFSDYAILKKIIASPTLQLVSFTITEKAYNVKSTDDSSAMAHLTALLFHRYSTSAAPLALVSMDNCSQNGAKLQAAVMSIASMWEKRGTVDSGFLNYLNDSSKISFPWTMIDKITPRPSKETADYLSSCGIQGMSLETMPSGAVVAPFVNAEKTQYLVVEDAFPNGRPTFEKVGVIMTTKENVKASESMKVTALLNPLHTALAVTGCLLGYKQIAQEMADEDLCRLVHIIGEKESLPVVEDVKIIDPRAFLKDVLENRLPNRFLPDMPQRIACDTSQKVPIRYGNTIRKYMEDNACEKLVGIPLAIATWFRYLLGVDDSGKPFEVSSDPMKESLMKKLSTIKLGEPSSYKGELTPLMKDKNIFLVDLYEAGLAKKIEEYFLKEISGIGKVRETLHSVLATVSY